MILDLAFIWAAVIAFAVLAYVVLDGFDLGVGILFPAIRGEKNRDLAMNTIAPLWDGNETWLVLGGGGLLAVFPLAYSIVMSALYAPIIAMLLFLIFRGVAFEFRWRTRRGKFLWDAAFFGGSLGAAFSQGVVLGALVQGIKVQGRLYAGGNWDWLTPFSVLTGIALVVGYALLGSTWLVMKTEGGMSRAMREIAKRNGLGLLVLIAVVSLSTPFLSVEYMHRWFDDSTIAFSFIVPFLVLLAAGGLVYGLRNGHARTPFLSALALFILSYIGLGISFYPYIVPPFLTIWQAAAPQSSLEFLGAGALVLVPMVLAHTVYVYWVFRGKTDPDHGYH